MGLIAGRVLLGDAAHPMTPDLGQGACQAIVDAWVLADRLRHGRTTEAALAEYSRAALADRGGRHRHRPHPRTGGPVAAPDRLPAP